MKQLILHGDCFDHLESIEDNSIDFICIDPPYGITAQTWDNVVSFDKLWTQFNRIRKSNCVIAIFGSQPFTTKVITSNLTEFKYCWYWVKNQATNFFCAKHQPLRKIEEIVIFGGKIYNPQISDGHKPTPKIVAEHDSRVYGGKNKRNHAGGKTTRYPDNVLDFKCVHNYERLHGNQKPVDLLEYLIRTYSNEGDVILDCFAGSGSTLVAAKNLNRQFIGIEQNEEFVQICEKRLEDDSFKTVLGI